MGLFDPVWKTENKKKIGKAIAYVGKVDDAAKLVDIARHAFFNEVKQAAIDRISDQSALAYIVANGVVYDYETKAALMRITDPGLLDQLAFTASEVSVRWAVLSRLAGMIPGFDHARYGDLIEGGVRAATAEMLVLCDDLALLEAAYSRHAHENYSWSIGDARAIRERANQVARARVAASTDIRELSRISGGSIYPDDVRSAAKLKAEALIIPEGATQQQLLEAACADSVVREAALARIVDQNLLSAAVCRIAILGSGNTLVDAVGRISDPVLLEGIARNERLEFATRKAAAEHAGIADAFGLRTLLCRECGGQIVYHEAYESYDSWKTEGWFRCEKHPGRMYVGDRLDDCVIGEAEPEELSGHLVFLCPECWGLRGSAAYHSPRHLPACTCGNRLTPIPVRFSIDY